MYSTSYQRLLIVSCVGVGQMIAAVGVSSGLTRSCLASKWRLCAWVSYSATAGSAWSCPGCTPCRTAAGPIALPGPPAQTSWRPSLRLTATVHPSRFSHPETHSNAEQFSQTWLCSTGTVAQPAIRGACVGNRQECERAGFCQMFLFKADWSAEMTNILLDRK